MNLRGLFKKRLTDGTDCEKIVGEEGLGKCEVLNTGYNDLLGEIEIGALVAACETCEYDSNELAIYKSGLMTTRLFIQQAAEEFELRKRLLVEKENEAKTEKQKRKNPTY